VDKNYPHLYDLSPTTTGAALTYEHDAGWLEAGYLHPEISNNATCRWSATGGRNTSRYIDIYSVCHDTDNRMGQSNDAAEMALSEQLARVPGRQPHFPRRQRI
jgi:hypothetical protein